MMTDCFCDYDAPSVYVTSKPVARIQHKCNECGCVIQVGESYEKVFGVWGGTAGTVKTCLRCVDLRDWVKAHVPCFCWAHHNLREDCIETARNYADQAPGLLFGMWRRIAAANLHKNMTRAALAHPYS